MNIAVWIHSLVVDTDTVWGTTTNKRIWKKTVENKWQHATVYDPYNEAN